MFQFEIKKEIAGMSENSPQNTKELIQQIRSLENFYKHLGFDSKNIKSIFKLTLSYLDARVDKLEVMSFFEALMQNDKILNKKELDLLVCFDGLLELHVINKSRNLDDNDEYQDVA